MRRAILTVTPEFFLAMLHGGLHEAYEVIEEGVPDDAKVVGARFVNQRFYILLESAEFEDVPENQMWPSLKPIMAREGRALPT